MTLGSLSRGTLISLSSSTESMVAIKSRISEESSEATTCISGSELSAVVPDAAADSSAESSASSWEKRAILGSKTALAALMALCP